MRITTLAVVALTFTAGIASADDDCRYREGRRVTAPIAGVTKIVVHGAAGTLHVDGRQGISEVLAAGTACTSESGFIDDMTLTARRSGSELHIEAHIPEKRIVFGFFAAKLDFGVVVPYGIAVEVEDGSGWLKVTNVGAARIEDGSGELEIRNVRGNLTVQDGSGNTTIDGVSGNVDIEDGSGELRITNVAGNVQIEDDSGSIVVSRVEGALLVRDDGSGSIDARNIRRGVTIDDDGSGAIDVADIGGDFTVHRKGSGNIDHVRVAGRVTIPRD